MCQALYSNYPLVLVVLGRGRDYHSHFQMRKMKPREVKQAAPGPHSNLGSGRTSPSGMLSGKALQFLLPQGPEGEASQERESLEETLRAAGRGGEGRAGGPRGARAGVRAPCSYNPLSWRNEF